MKKILLCLALVCAAGQGFGQEGEKPDALAAYRRGRDAEGRRPAEAERYYADSVRICNDEIAQNRATRDTYTVLCWTLQRQKKYRDVLSWGERGRGLYPDDLRIVEIMGEAYFYLDNYAASLRSMQRYINGLPRGDRAANAFFFSGEIYRLQKKFRKADIAYSAAVNLERSNALWWYRLGLAREGAGENADAAAAFKQAIQLNPNYPEAKDGLARVQAKGT
ncbi:MAG: tetratricopeptide repeat protein [Treponema sp.]|jgi:tetratricopeptide (TPR) repeat protein|nr:tetratricopeptide repeat protein [Treponema sp.]